jgi:hypothetical protein
MVFYQTGLWRAKPKIFAILAFFHHYGILFWTEGAVDPSIFLLRTGEIPLYPFDFRYDVTPPKVKGKEGRGEASTFAIIGGGGKLFLAAIGE